MQCCDSLLYLWQTEVCHGVNGVQHSGCLLEVTLAHMMLRSPHRLDVGIANIRAHGCGEGTNSVTVKVITADAVLISLDLVLRRRCFSRLCSGRWCDAFLLRTST